MNPMKKNGNIFIKHTIYEDLRYSLMGTTIPNFVGWVEV